MLYLYIVLGSLCISNLFLLLVVLLALGNISQSADAHIQEGKS